VRLQHFFDDHHRATAGTAVRVSAAVSPTFRPLEPKRWNNPAGAWLIGIPLSIGPAMIPRQ
jgi:hypothetical protein